MQHVEASHVDESGNARAKAQARQPNLYAAASAIASAIQVSRSIRSPIVALVVGEACAATSLLAFGVPNIVLMLENAVLRLPIGAKVHAKRTDDADGSDGDEELTRVLTAREAFELGIVDAVVKEPPGGAHRMPTSAMDAAGQAVALELAHLREVDPAELKMMRERRLSALDELCGNRAEKFIEAAAALVAAEEGFLLALREASL